MIIFGLVWLEALRPSQQLFSHVGTEPPLPGYYQYHNNCILAQVNKVTLGGIKYMSAAELSNKNKTRECTVFSLWAFSTIKICW